MKSFIQVKLSITSFSDEAQIEMPMNFYTTEQVYENVNTINWVGGLTNMKAGIELGASTIDTTDDIADIMIIITDGFDSFDSAAVIEEAADVTASGITTIAVGFGQNNFINFFQMNLIARDRL